MSELDDLLNEADACYHDGEDSGNHATGPARAELAALRAKVANLIGAMAAQDAREAMAGALCEVPYAEHGCDWPQAMADTVIHLRARVAALEKTIEAGDALMLSIDTMVDVEFREDGERSGYEDDVVDAIAAYRAAREASRE